MTFVLLAEDEPIQRMSVRKILERELGARVIEAADGAEALLRLKDYADTPFDVALVDLNMPSVDGFALLRHARKQGLSTPFLVLTGSDRVEDAVEAMRAGAVDFISKPAVPERILTSVRNALSLSSLKAQVKELRQHTSAPADFGEIIAVSPTLKELAELGRKAAQSDIPVLITGESGVGKEVFARAVHAESRRADRAFVAVNCGALPDNLIESTLFGHEKGSFTGAVNRTLGKCREADGGVLFLDEVGELKLDAQVKLLRMLQQGEIEPVGSGTPVKVDVRVVSATNRPLEQLVAQGRFREDLYYRLQGLPLHIVPLRERRRDIPSLAKWLLARLAKQEQCAEPRLTEEALAWLSHHAWPGNVRELHHVLARALLLAENDVIDVADVSRWAQSRPALAPTNAPGTLTVSLEGPGGFKTLEQIEQEVIEATLARFGGHVGRAAAALGVGQSTLYKRLRTG